MEIQEHCKYINTQSNKTLFDHHCPNTHHRAAPEYDKAAALEQSRKILASFELPTRKLEDANFTLSTCFFCKTLMPQNPEANCHLCEEVFCCRHRSEMSHHCEKLNKETAKYLNAKNQFKLKLREVKSKAGR